MVELLLEPVGEFLFDAFCLLIVHLLREILSWIYTNGTR
jgi:hypothetical protein